jgi:hypothetical protein
MSGALVELVSKGVQDVFLSDQLGESFFKIVFKRHTPFAQVAKRIDIKGDGNVLSLKIPSMGDLLTYVWLEGDNLASNLVGSVFEFYVGGAID